MEKYIGKIAQTGIAVGNVVKLGNTTFSECQKFENPQAEIEKLRSSVAKAKLYLKNLVDKQSEQNSEIAETSLLMLDDKFVAEIGDTIQNEKLSAVSAINKVCRIRAEKMQSLANESLRSRSVDIMGLSKLLVKQINGVDEPIEIKSNTVLVAKDLTPQELLDFDLSKVVALVTQDGNPTTHVSIIAGNNGLPYIYGIDVESIVSSDNIVVDGLSGCIIVNPDENTLSTVKTQINDYIDNLKQLQHSDCKTKTHIYANISNVNDIQLCLQNNCDGVGLFRSECLFMADSMPSEDSQFEAYKSILQNMSDKEVVIRTLDIGSDKQASWLKLPSEENPALGLRGVRVCFAYPDIFKTQLRALLRAGVFGNLSVMFPMITSVNQVEQIKLSLDKVAKQLDEQHIAYKMPKLGVMIETPAAVLVSDELAKLVDFFSIGTNDLTQYTLALDRQAKGLETFYEPHHESIYKLIEMTVKSAKSIGIKVAICGELACDSKVTKRLVEIGVDELSVSPNKILAVRNHVSHAECQINNESAKNIKIGSPANGTLIRQNDIPDPVFAEGTLGKCFAVQPSDGEIYAPCDGTIVNIAETLHAFTIQTCGGDKILVHIGLDTVTLGGDGFVSHIKVGDSVSLGQNVMTVDLDKIRAKGLNAMVIVVKTGC